MDFFCQYDETNQSSSDNSNNAPMANFLEEEVSLASNNPKKPSGRKVFKETRHPVYRGVRKRNGNKWGCEMRDPNKKNSRIWLGTFPTAEMAARAHDVAAIALKGRSACLNFADSAWRLPIPASTDKEDILKAATEAAEAFREVGTVEGETSIIMPENMSSVSSFMDEEEVFNMPRLLADMAEGLMFQPPPHCVDQDTEMETNVDISLWDY